MNALNEKTNIGQKFLAGVKQYLKRNGGILIGLIAICLVVSFRSERFLTYENIMNVLRQIAQNVFLASGIKPQSLRTVPHPGYPAYSPEGTECRL